MRPTSFFSTMESFLADGDVLRAPLNPKFLLQFVQMRHNQPVTLPGSLKLVRFTPKPYSTPCSNSRGFKEFPAHQNPPYAPQPEPVYPSHIMRVSSAPNLYAQNTIADSTGNRRPSPIPCFSTAPSNSYEAFHGQQDPNTLATGTTSYDRQYLNPTDALYPSQSRAPEYYGAPRGFSTSSDGIAPHILQGRQNSWDDPGVESSYETTTWSSGTRAGYREPMTFDSTGQTSNYQYSTVSSMFGFAGLVGFSVS